MESHTMLIHTETERLIIRDWSLADVDPYLEIVSDPEVMRYIGDGHPRDRAYAESFVQKMIALQETQGWMRFAIALRETGELMGFCGFAGLEDGTIDFGWRYSRKFWGGGFGSEAALAVLALGQDTFHLTRIESKSYPENVGSVRIMEKMGMQYLRTSEENGRPVVHYGFADL